MARALSNIKHGTADPEDPKKLKVFEIEAGKLFKKADFPGSDEEYQTLLDTGAITEDEKAPWPVGVTEPTPTDAKVQELQQQLADAEAERDQLKASLAQAQGGQT